jgi:hypothetical protein
LAYLFIRDPAHKFPAKMAFMGKALLGDVAPGGVAGDATG